MIDAFRRSGFATCIFGIVAIFIALAMASGFEMAQAAQPVDWQMNLQPAATKHMADINEFHTFLLWIITAITSFVLLLLLIIMVRFNARVNPTPAKFTHNTLIEIVWTVVPIVILIVIAIPSFRLLYQGDVIPKADMTIKVTGLPSWAWVYNYPDAEGLEFQSNLLPEDQAKAKGEPWLLAVDNRMVVPVGKTVRLQVTSEAGGIIHAWTIPSFGVKIDAIPGKLNETWFKVEREGVYYGQCSELCGVKHAYMPIAVEAVSEARFAQWLVEAKAQFGANETPEKKLAAQ
jgi:cytochrome c oxidase subunit 2